MSDTKLTPFLFEGDNLIRVAIADDAPWFIGADICKVLGLGNPSQAFSRLDEDERSTLIIDEGAIGGPARIIISEPGVYRLIFTSRKPEAERFKRWLAHEVLPSIRVTGGYGAGFDPKVLGGIVKSIVYKAIDIAIEKKIPDAIEALIARDTRIAVGEYVSVRELLDEAKALPKGRNSINRKIGNALRDICLREGGARRCPRTRTWLFPVSRAHDYMRTDGLALVADHNAAVMGQGVLHLVRSRKKPDTAAPNASA